MNQAHLDLLKQGVTAWSSQQSWIASLSGEELQASYQRYLEVLREIEGKRFDNVSLGPMSLEDYRESFLEGAAYLEGADLRGMDLRGYNLSWCSLKGANLSATDLRDSYLVHADLTEAHLSGADLEKAHLDRASLYERWLSKRAWTRQR